MPSLKEFFVSRLQTGLNRASIQSASSWALQYRMMGKPYPGKYSFDHHPWCKAMHDSKAPINVGMKSAQAGYTETVLNIAFYTIDILKEDVLYVLPNQTPDAKNFSASRFDAALDLSKHLENLFSDVKNVGHKRAGSNNLFIRGSQSRIGLKSVSTAKIILDELDEMNQKNIELSFERASGQKEEDRLVWMLSTPTVENHGIHKWYLDTTQEHVFFQCPCCSKHIELTFPECLEITGEDLHDPKLQNSFLKCPSCKNKLDHDRKNEYINLKSIEWVPEKPGRKNRGFHVNQLYSPTISPVILAESYIKSLKDPTAEQEFFNSKLGKPHVVKGAQVTDDDIKKCERSYAMFNQGYDGPIVCMGVDVGKKLHFVIKEYFLDPTISLDDINDASKSKLLYCGTRDEFEELDILLYNYNVKHCIIDANPERRKAKEFCSRNYGKAHMCFYGNNIKGKYMHVHDPDLTVTVDRTAWLDQTLGRFKNMETEIPVNVPPDYKTHIKAQVKRYDVDKDGNPVSRYITVGPEDHYGHAENYCEIALPIAAGFGQNYTIKGPR
jgi:hypothetical protein